jgi:RimJ/RimL family protein N-acetyltransferase
MPLPDPLRLMRLHVEALYIMDGRGRLIAANVPGGGTAPRFFLGRTARGSEWWYREDVGARLAGELEAACHSEGGSETLDPPYGATMYEEILSRHAPITRVWTGPAFSFPDSLTNPEGVVEVTEANRDILLRHLSSWLPDASLGIPLYATVVEDRAVAVCGSVRVTRAAHEAGVETAPAFRGKGYAGRAARGWAAGVRDLGVQPLYSTSWDNAASRGLANALGLLRFGSDLHIT